MEDTPEGPTIVAKVADFGLSRSLMLAGKLSTFVIGSVGYVTMLTLK